MDELFCDVTDMVQAHLRSIKAQPENQDEGLFFNLTEDVTSEPKGFHYQTSDTPSLTIPGTSSSKEAQYAPQLLAAAHLASYIRKEIFDKLRFTTSAGIAHNKLIAKLVGNLNKPNLQTTWNPDVRNWQTEQESFLAGFEARQ
jgi:DNA polymerase iota